MPNVPTKTTPETRSTRAGSTASPKPGLMHQANSGTNISLSTVTSNSSDKSMVVNTPLSQDSRDEKILYPFRVRHLGKDTYTLFAASAKNRQEWCEKILEARTKHAASLFAQNAEPFRVRIVADSAFAYDTYSAAPRSVLVKGTPLHRALQDVEKQHQHLGRPAPICRAKVNCATSFTQHSGQYMLAIGTDYGVYLAESGKARGWTRVNISRKFLYGFRLTHE